MDTAFDRINDHLQRRGLVPVPPELEPDLEKVARQARVVKALGNKRYEYDGFVCEISPYLQTLLRLEGLGAEFVNVNRIAD